MATVELKQAIWLSLNVDPGSAERTDAPFESASVAEKVRVQRINAWARFDIAISHAKSRSLKIEADFDSEPDLWKVRLADFRAWGESLPAPLGFPDEFPRLTGTVAPVAHEAAEDKPRRTPRNDNANLRIIAAMLALLRDKDGGRFPSDAKVIDHLVEKYGAADGISKRNLEKVFPAAKQAAGDDLKPSKRTAS